MSRFNSRKSFTLIELLIVLAIVAILSVVVILTLNPAELLKQSRDSTRLSDLSTLNTSLSVYNADVSGGFVGTSSVIYVSIPDTTSTCANLGLPSLPTGWSYSCVTATSTRNANGTGWIPVNFTNISFGSPLSALPIDPVNTTSSNLYYTYMSGGSFKLSAMSLEAQKNQAKTTSDGGVADTSYELGNNLSLGAGVFPSGWVKVPGDSTFGTSDFYIMKYEAKCASSTNMGAGLTSPNSGHNSYDNSSAACTAINSRAVVSTASGYPMANISQINAITYCQSIGAHLITNNEWQTIAWNTENVSSNWFGGVVGTNYIYSGHNDAAPSVALEASTDDSNGYYGETNVGGNQRRTLTLSNGSVIWDIAANVSEWTNDTITGTNQPWAVPAGFTYREFTAITNWGTMTQQTAGPANASWNSTKGMGKIYSDGSVNATVYAFYRGGLLNASLPSGVEALELDSTPGSTAWSIGFRCTR